MYVKSQHRALTAVAQPNGDTKSSLSAHSSGQLSHVSGQASLTKVPLYVKSQPKALTAVAQPNGDTKSSLSAHPESVNSERDKI